MSTVVKIIKFIFVALLSVLYWPLNTLFLYMKKHYLKWEKEDRISFIIATPLYYFLFLIVVILSYPLETIGQGLHPPLSGFK